LHYYTVVIVISLSLQLQQQQHREGCWEMLMIVSVPVQISAAAIWEFENRLRILGIWRNIQEFWGRRKIFKILVILKHKTTTI